MSFPDYGQRLQDGWAPYWPYPPGAHVLVGPVTMGFSHGEQLLLPTLVPCCLYSPSVPPMGSLGTIVFPHCEHPSQDSDFIQTPQAHFFTVKEAVVPSNNSGAAWREKKQRPVSKPASIPTFPPDDINENEVQELADLWAAQMAAGKEEKNALVSNAFRLATENQTSSRAIQLALDSMSGENSAALAFGLRTRVREAIRCKNVNFVINKIVDVLSPENVSFVVTELQGFAAVTARHRYGCRVLRQLIRNSLKIDYQGRSLIDELLNEMDSLIRHTYGYHVIEHIVEHGLPQHKHTIAEAMRENIFVSAKFRNSSYIIQKVLEFCADERKAIVDVLLHEVYGLVDLAGHKCGCHVVLRLLWLPAEFSRPVADRLRPQLAVLRQTHYGSIVADKLCDAVNE